MVPPKECAVPNRGEEGAVVPPEEPAVANRGEEGAVVPSKESAVANRGEQGVLLPTEESAVLRTDSVAAPNRNLADFVEKMSGFDENWGVLDENSAPAGLAAWPAFPPNIIPK